MIVTTGARASRSSASSSNTSAASTSSAACVIVISRSSSVPISSTASSVSDCVMPTSSPRPIIVFWMTAVETLSVVARSFTVTPDGTVTGPVGATASSRLSERSPPPRPRPRPWLRVSRAGRAAPVSITTRRRRPAAAPLRCGRERRGGSEPGVPGPGLGRAPPPSLTPGPSTRPPPAGLEPWAGRRGEQVQTRQERSRRTPRLRRVATIRRVRSARERA